MSRMVFTRVEPVISAAIYAAGDYFHNGILEFSFSVPQGVSPQRQCRLKGLRLIDVDDEGAEINWYIFKADSAAFETATPVANAAGAIDDDDVLNRLIGIIQTVTADYVDGGGVKIATSDADIPLPAGARKVHVIGLTVGTPTFTAITDVAVELIFDWE